MCGNKMKISCANGTSGMMLLIVEPWADEYRISPGVSVDIVGMGGMKDGAFEVEYFDKGIIFYGWAGCSVSVFIDGKEVIPNLQE